MPDKKPMTDFGYREVAPKEKARLVERVFSSVAESYDLMNDLMSMGVHRLWKRRFVASMGLRPGEWLLDVAGGTGDIAALALERLRPAGSVVLADINRDMLEVGRRRMDNAGRTAGIEWVQADAEALPFADRRFHHLSIVFGLRNVTDRQRALGEMFRVLKPGGRVHIMEFSEVSPGLLARLYDLWSFQVMPRLGRMVAGDAESYQYLAESIRRFPDRETLAGMMREAGFDDVGFEVLNQGICAIHRGIRL